MTLSATDFSYLRQLLASRAALQLEAGKEYLVLSRLTPLARRHALSSVSELVAQLRREQFGALHSEVVEAMTTNETSFFRDIYPFEALRTTVLPALIEARSTTRQINVWSAACSSGQEPYSIAMIVREHFPQLASWNVRILATDISTEMLARAVKGAYTPLEVSRGLPAALLSKYFIRQGANWQLLPEIRRMVEYREMNLAEVWPPFPSLDIVFLRNVLIYFGVATKRDVLGRLKGLLRPDGYLFLGGAETTINLDESFERAQVGGFPCYRLRDAQGVSGAIAAR